MAPDVSQEIESPPKEAEQLKSLWRIIGTAWLKRYFSNNLAARDVQDAREHPYLALSRLSASDEVEVPVKPGHFIVVTHAPAKLQLISEVIQSQGGVAEPVLLLDEESVKELGREAVRKWGSGVYSLEMASGKARDFKRKAFESGKTLFSQDTSVISPRGQILEKPRDEEDIERMLKLVNGKTVRIMVGASALVPLRYGQLAVRLEEGAEISLKVRDLSDDEIVKYFETNKEHALEVAGGIDFSTAAGQQLIDISKPIQIKPFGGTIYDLFSRNREIIRKPVTIDVNDAAILADYFKGAPMAIISVLMRQSQEIQEQIERL